MKKLTFFLCLIIALAVVVLSSLIDSRMTRLENEALDSAFFAKMIQNKTNLEFKTSDEFCIYQQNLIDNSEKQNMFIKLDPSVVRNVSDVCIKKYNKVNMNLFFKEYEEHKLVFDTISNKEIVNDTITLDSVGSTVDTIIYVNDKFKLLLRNE